MAAQKTHLSWWSQGWHCAWLRRSQLRAVDGLAGGSKKRLHTGSPKYSGPVCSLYFEPPGWEASQREIHPYFTVHHADAVQERDVNLQMAALVRVCDNLPTVPLTVRVQNDDMGSRWQLVVGEKSEDGLQKRTPLPTAVFEQPRSQSIGEGQATRTSNKHMLCRIYSTLRLFTRHLVSRELMGKVASAKQRRQLIRGKTLDDPEFGGLVNHAIN